MKKLVWVCVLAGMMLLGVMATMAWADGPIVDLDNGDEDFRIVGLNALDYLGEVASGDINADGIADLIIGASGTDLTGPTRDNAGATFVIWGTSDGLSGTLDLDSSPADLIVHSRGTNFYMGRFVASGDINGDGVDDLLIGADAASEDSHTYNGAVYALFGSSSLSGTVDLYTDTADLEVYGAEDFDRMGRSIATCDVNGDTVADLIMGAYRDATPGGTDAGAVYVIFGSTDLSGTIALDSDGADFTILGNDAYDRLGRSVACGDVDGDGTADIIAGAYWADQAWGNDAGEVYVVYGNTTLSGTLDLDSDSPDILLRGVADSDEAGFYVASGDVNGDGSDDILIGAYYVDVDWPGSETGAAYMVYGSDSLASTINLSETADVAIYGAAQDDRLSRSLSSGDFNGDGYDDILIGASRADPATGRDDAGISYVIYGAPEISSAIYLSDTNQVAIQVLGDDQNDEAGRASGSGDLNNDGADDLIIGAVLALGTDSGETYVVHGSTATTLTLSPASETITAGQPVTFTATASNKFGDWDITSMTAFTIAQAAGGTWLDNVYTSEKTGAWIVTGTFQSVVATATLTVNHAVLDRVGLAPDSETRTAGQSIVYTLTAYDTYDNPWDVTSSGSYTITSGAGGEWVSNVYTTEVAGAWTVTGAYNGENDTAALTVNHADAASVALDPATEILEAGETVTYTVVATDTHGNSWDATGEAGFDIEAGAGGSWTDNVYTSAIAGTWTVTGTVDGVDGIATLTVNHADAASVALDPATEILEAGEAVTYTVVATDTHGNSWDATSEAGFDIEAGAGGSWTDNVYTSAIAGTWTVTGTVDGVDGLATVTVNHADAVSAALDPAAATREAGQDVTYTVVATDTHGNSWDATGEAGFDIEAGAGGSWTDNVYTSEVAGTWAVTGTVDGVDGLATLTVNHADAASVMLDPATEILGAGEAVTYTVVATDTYGNSWDATGEAGFDIEAGAGGSWTDNVYTSAMAGTWAVTGTVDGVDGIAALTVNHAALDRVDLTPESETRTAGQSIAYTLTAYDAYNNPWDVTSSGSYTITSGAEGEWVSSVYTSEVAGTWTVTATYSGESDTATLEVNHAGLNRVDLTPGADTREAGQPIAYTLTAYDAYDNSWDVTSSGSYTITPGAGGEWATNVYTTEVVGTWTVTGTFGAYSDAAALTVVAGTLHHIVIEDGAGGAGSAVDTHTMTAGESFDVWAAGYDVGNNYLGDYSVTWSGTGVVAGGLSPTSGVSTTFTAGTAGTGAIQADAGGSIIDATGTITVNSGALHHIVIEDGAGGAGSAVGTHVMTAGESFDVWAAGYDVGNNYLGDYSVTWSGTGVVVGGLIPTNGISTTFTAGTAGMGIIQADAGGSIIDTTGTITVNPGSLHQFVFATIPSPQTMGEAFAVTITAQDEYNNTATGYGGTATLTDTTGTISPTVTGNFGSGVWTGNVTITQAQSDVTITAEDGSALGTSNSFDVEFKIYLPLVVRGG